MSAALTRMSTQVLTWWWFSLLLSFLHCCYRTETLPSSVPRSDVYMILWPAYRCNWSRWQSYPKFTDYWLRTRAIPGALLVSHGNISDPLNTAGESCLFFFFFNSCKKNDIQYFKISYLFPFIIWTLLFELICKGHSISSDHVCLWDSDYMFYSVLLNCFLDSSSNPLFSTAFVSIMLVCSYFPCNFQYHHQLVTYLDITVTFGLFCVYPSPSFDAIYLQ